MRLPGVPGEARSAPCCSCSCRFFSHQMLPPSDRASGKSQALPEKPTLPQRPLLSLRRSQLSWFPALWTGLSVSHVNKSERVVFCSRSSARFLPVLPVFAVHFHCFRIVGCGTMPRTTCRWWTWASFPVLGCQVLRLTLSCVCPCTHFCWARTQECNCWVKDGCARTWWITPSRCLNFFSNLRFHNTSVGEFSVDVP